MRPLLLAAILLASAPAMRIGHVWSFEELAEKSDVVVIAEVLADRGTGERHFLTDLRPGVPVLERLATFKVLLVLRGLHPGDHIEVQHFELDREVWGPGPGGMANGPYWLLLKRGRGQGILTDAYLLFVQQRGHVWVPTSGQVDPHNSIFKLSLPGTH